MKLRLSHHTAILFATISVALSACTNREVPITQHEGPLVGDETVRAEKTGPVDVDALKKLDTKALVARVKSNSPQAADQDLQSLAPFVLNASYVENPRIAAGSAQMRSAVMAFNLALVDLYSKNPQAARPWLEKARVVLESGCDGELRGCVQLRPSLPLFQGDANSAKIMELLAREVDRELNAKAKCASDESDAAKMCLAERADLLRLYYRRLAIAFEYKNRTPDSQFEFMYLARASEYTESLNNANREEAKKDYSPEQARRLTRINAIAERHSEVFEIILNHFSPDLKNPEMRKQFEGFVNAFAPWTYSRNQKSPFGQAATRMLTLAAQNFLYKDDKNSLNESLSASIKESQKDLVGEELDRELKKDLEASFAAVAKNLKETERSIWKNLSLNDDFARDEYFFMVDRLFGGHLNADDASEIWRGSRRDTSKLLAVAEKYLKIEIASQIVRTNKYMSTIYSNKDWSSSTLFQKAVEKSYPISMQWSQLLVKIDRVQLFIDRNLKVAEGQFASTELKNISLMLSSIRRNIKYLSVYPNMMLMAYFMAEVDFKFEVYSFFGKIEIDSATIISWFFDGKLAPLFNFGNDGESLRRIETLYAFLFALKTDTFKAFSVNKEPISVAKFFEVVIGKFLDADRVDLELALESIRKDTKQSDKLTRFLKVCREDRGLIDAQGKLSLKSSPISFDLDSMTKSTYVGSSHGLGSEAHSLYGGTLNRKIKEFASGLRARLNFVNVMIGLFEQHLISSGVSESERNEMASKIRSNLNTIETLQAEYLTEIVNANDQIGPCLEQSVPLEIDRQNALLKLEAQHLESVWKAMKAARDGNSASLTQANKDLIEGLGLKDIPNGNNFQPLSRISTDSYTYGELDVLLRFRQHFKKVAPSVEIIMPSDLTDTSWWRARRVVAIPFYDDVKEFVRQGMRNFSDNGASYINYYGALSDPEFLNNRLRLLTELYKLGKFSIYNVTSGKCTNVDNITTCPLETYTVSPERLVNEMTRTIKILSLTDERKAPKSDVEILNIIGSPSRWNRDKLREFLLDKNNDPISYFESIYKTMTSDETEMTEAREFQSTDRSVGHFLFSPEDSFKKVLRGGFTPQVQAYFAKVKLFEETVAKKEQLDASAGRVLEFTYEIRRGEFLRTPVEMIGNRPVYLSRQKVEDFKTRQELFHRETDGFFNQPQ